MTAAERWKANQDGRRGARATRFTWSAPTQSATASADSRRFTLDDFHTSGRQSLPPAVGQVPRAAAAGASSRWSSVGVGEHHPQDPRDFSAQRLPEAQERAVRRRGGRTSTIRLTAWDDVTMRAHTSSTRPAQAPRTPAQAAPQDQDAPVDRHQARAHRAQPRPAQRRAARAREVVPRVDDGRHDRIATREQTGRLY